MAITDLNPQINIYSNLLNQKTKLHDWNSEESFDVRDLNSRESTIIQQLEAIEVCFSGVGTNRFLFDSLFKTFEAFVKQFVLFPKIQSYIFKSEFKKQIKNRVRSYKGIISKEINNEDYIQFEIPIKDGYTIFAALIKLNEKNIGKTIEYLFDSSISCIIAQDDKCFYSEDTIRFIVCNVMNHKGTSNINYAKLIAKFCVQGAIISRVNGDGGDREVSFQSFCKKDKRDLVILQDETSLKSII